MSEEKIQPCPCSLSMGPHGIGVNLETGAARVVPLPSLPWACSLVGCEVRERHEPNSAKCRPDRVVPRINGEFVRWQFVPFGESP